MQDATPLTLGQEISGWVRMLEKGERNIKSSSEELRELAIGGTAVGTGLNAPKGFGDLVSATISKLTGKTFTSAPNKFHALTSHNEVFLFVHGAFKALAADLTEDRQ